MPKRPTVDTVSTGFTSQTTINNNFTNVRNQFDNTLSLDGSTPNAMQADLDMDSNDILNARTLRADNIFINGVAVTSGEAAAAPVATDVVITDAGGFYAGSNVETALAELGALNDVTASATEINYLTGTTSAVQTQLDSKAPLASPALTGTPTAPTASAGTNTTQLATTAFVQNQISPTQATHTTVMTGATTGTVTLSDDQIGYVRIGNLVIFSGRLIVSSVSGMSGDHVNTTLPFSCAAGLENETGFSTTLIPTSGTITTIPCRVGSGSSQLQFFDIATTLAAGDDLIIGGTYLTDDP